MTLSIKSAITEYGVIQQRVVKAVIYEKAALLKKGRIIERSIYQEAIETNKKRVEENPDYYKIRQQIT